MPADVPLSVRDCAGADLESLEQVLPAGGHRVQLANAQAGRRDFLVACRGQRPVGTVVVRWAGVAGGSADLGAVVPEIGSLAVALPARRRGVGAALVAAAEARVRQRGFDSAAILVSATSTGARRLYERLGYRDSGRRRRTAEGVDHVLTRRLLGG